MDIKQEFIFKKTAYIYYQKSPIKYIDNPPSLWFNKQTKHQKIFVGDKVMIETPSLTLREQIALALLKILAENKGKKIEIETDNGNTTGGKIKAIRDGVILEMTVETDGGGQEDGFINPLAIKELYIVQKEGIKPLEDEENNSLEEDESENKPKKPAELKN